MTITIDSIANGGAGVARRDGKVVFVEGGLVGDVVEVEVLEDKGRFEMATITRVVEASPHRIEPPCPLFGNCGGCMWQHASYSAQLEWKRQIVQEQLHRIGRLEVEVAPTIAPTGPYGYRNRMDFTVSLGSPALKARRSHRDVAVPRCLLLAPALADLLPLLDGITGSNLTLRVGVSTGEIAAIGDGSHPTVPILPVDRAVIHEVVGEVVFRISGLAFFQVNTAGAEVLVSLAKEMAGDLSGKSLLDLYAGGGLFTATVGATADQVTAVEWNRRAVADLAVNAPGARRIDSPVEEALGKIRGPVDVVVADPPRDGIGKRVVEGIVRLAPSRVVLVSCDPGSFARDARLLVDSGFRLGRVRPVDMFPQTAHIEMVGLFERI